MQSQANRVNTASPFPTPSSSPGAVPAPAVPEWSGGSDWSSSGASARSSPAQTPPQEASRCPTPAIVTLESFLPALYQLVYPNLPLPPVPVLPPHALPSRPSTPSTPKQTRVPRPANAFMLFRSHMIKTGKIPKDVEQRQQNISRVAGECWNMLSPEEKEVWHAKARQHVEEHKARHPDYKFSPTRKQSRRKTPDIPGKDAPDHIRYIREKYCGIQGPAVPPPRPRKHKSRRGVGTDAPATPSPTSHSLPSSQHPSPSTTPDFMTRVPSAPPTSAAFSSQSRPQSATGFRGPNPDFSHAIRDMTPYSEYLSRFFSQTAHETNKDKREGPLFGDLSAPDQGKFDFSSMHTLHNGRSEADAPFGLASSSFFAAGPSSLSVEESLSQTPSKWDAFLNIPGDGFVPSDPASLADTIGTHGDTSAYALDEVLDSNEVKTWY